MDEAGGNFKKKKTADVSQLSKEDLLERIRQLEFHVNQLKNVIAKKDGHNKTAAKTSGKQRPLDWSKQNKRHVALKIAYLGWDYKGFVVQEDTNMTIENAIFDALLRARLIESRETSNYHRCGRTDKGVSAFCQVISIDLRSVVSTGVGVIVADANGQGDSKSELDYVAIINRILPSEIRVLAWAPVNVDFSARFDCKSRTYKYFFPRGDLNIDAMNEAASKLVGAHDFRNLCKMDVGNGVTEFIRRIDSAEVSVEADQDGYSTCVFTIVSKAYLWHQIRCIMAILFTVGKGLEAPQILDEMFDVERYPCKPQYTMACELPLNLYDCSYDDVQWTYDKETLERTVSHLQKMWAETNIKTVMLRSMIDSLVCNMDGEPQHQADLLVPDYRRRAQHRPLMQRTTCSSLEDRKEYFAKRRKLDKFLSDKPATE